MTSAADPTLITIGHGTRATSERAVILSEASVALLVDVRRHPGSRRHPHFARDRLAVDLPALGIRYEWWGEDLGGRRRPAGLEARPETHAPRCRTRPLP